MADNQQAAGEKPISKNEAVRRAIDYLGTDASRTQIKDYVQETFGIEMSADHVSTARADALRRLKAKKNPGKKRGRKPKEEVSEASEPATKPQQPAPVSNGKGGVQPEDIQTLKGLVGRIGADAVRKWIEVIS